MLDIPYEKMSVEWLKTAQNRKERFALSLPWVSMDVSVTEEDEEPIAGVIKHSSRPKAARGWELHRKVNEDYRHCDVPFRFASHLAPQTRSHALLMLGLYELTLNAVDRMEQRLARSFGIEVPDDGYKGIQSASSFHASGNVIPPLQTAA